MAYTQTILIDYYNAPAYAVVLALASIAAGLALAVGGYRFRRAAMFTTALFTIGNFAIVILYKLDPRFLVEESWYYTAYVAAGLVCGGIALLRTKVGLGVTGFGAGAVLAQLILSMVNFSGSYAVFVIVLLIGGATGAALTLWLEKPAFIVATSFVGMNAFAMDGIAYFVYRHIVTTEMHRHVDVGYQLFDSITDKINSMWWTMLAFTLALTLGATAVQLLVTARGIDHDCIEPATDGPQFSKVQTPQQGAERVANPIALV